VVVKFGMALTESKKASEASEGLTMFA